MKTSHLFSVLHKSLILLVFLSLLWGCAKKAERPPQPAPRPSSAPVVQPYEHRVRYSGETLGLISSWYTGKSSNWQLILEANPGVRPERINIGDVLLIPKGIMTRREPMPERFVSGALRSSSEQKQKTESLVEEAQTDIPGDDSSSSSASPSAYPRGADSEEALAPLSSSELELLSKPSAEAPRVEDKPTEAADSISGDDLERERLLDELLQE